MPFNQTYHAVNLNVSNYESLTVGLTAEETKMLIETINGMKTDDRKELDKYLHQINEAATEDEKKSLGQKAAELIRERGWSIFDSLVTNGLLALAKGAGA